MDRPRRARTVGLTAVRWRRAGRLLLHAVARAHASAVRAVRASTGAILSFSGLACAPAAAWFTWGIAGLLWVAFPVLIVAGAAVERMLNAGT